jgi:hypothetical protein
MIKASFSVISWIINRTELSLVRTQLFYGCNYKACSYIRRIVYMI